MRKRTSWLIGSQKNTKFYCYSFKQYQCVADNTVLCYVWIKSGRPRNNPEVPWFMCCIWLLWNSCQPGSREVWMWRHSFITDGQSRSFRLCSLVELHAAEFSRCPTRQTSKVKHSTSTSSSLTCVILLVIFHVNQAYPFSLVHSVKEIKIIDSTGRMRTNSSLALSFLIPLLDLREKSDYSVMLSYTNTICTEIYKITNSLPDNFCCCFMWKITI